MQHMRRALLSSMQTMGLCAVLLGGCADRRLPPASASESTVAEATAKKLESDLQALRDLTGPKKRAAEIAFGPRLEHDLAQCQGTRHESWPLFQLAAWTLNHGGANGPDRTLSMLDRLERLSIDAFRGYPASELRIRALLRLGRTIEAKNLAARIDEKYPVAGLLKLVEFYELVGNTAPSIPGMPVGPDSLADNPVLVCFIGAPDASAREWLEPYKQALIGRSVQLVVIITAGNMLAAAAAATDWQNDMRWLRSGDPSLSVDWRLPGVPVALLLGAAPKRMVLAVDPQPSDLLLFARPR